MDFKQFDLLTAQPPEIQGRFNSFVTTAFDDSMTAEMQIRSITKWATKNFLVVDSLINFSNALSIFIKEFIEAFDNKLETTLTSVLIEWQSSGKLTHIINEALQTRIDSIAVDIDNLQRNKLDRNENESITTAMLSPEIKQALNDGVWEFNMNTSNIVDNAVTESKLSEQILVLLKNNSNWKDKTILSMPNTVSYLKDEYNNFVQATYLVGDTPVYFRISTSNSLATNIVAGRKYYIFANVKVVAGESFDGNVKINVQTASGVSNKIESFSVASLSQQTNISGVIDVPTSFTSSDLPFILFTGLKKGSTAVIQLFDIGIIDITNLNVGHHNKVALSKYLKNTYSSISDSLTIYKKMYENDLKTASIAENLNSIDYNAKIVLPNVIPCVVGKTLNIWYDNILQGVELKDVSRISMDGSTKNADDVWSYTPKVSDVVKTTRADLQLRGIDYDYDLQKNTKIVPVALNSGGSKTIKVLYIGDSRTDQGVPTGEFTKLFDTDTLDVELLGVRGSESNKHEGRSGWSAKNYCNDSSFNGFTNPFFNGTIFDFSFYMTQQNYAKVDYVIIQLGKNDINPYDVSTFLSYIQKMLDSIKLFNSSIKVILTLSESFSNVLKDGNKFRSLLYTQGIIDYFNNSMVKIYNPNVFLSTDYLNVDLLNDFPNQTSIVNPRNTEITRKYVTDGTHPFSAYGKIADCHYYMIKYIESLV